MDKEDGQSEPGNVVRRVYKGEDCLKEEEREGIIKILMN
jgi:hypothetical protein